MKGRHRKTGYKNLVVSLAVSVLLLTGGVFFVEHLSFHTLVSRLLWPLTRLMGFIAIGLVFGQVIEAAGWLNFFAAFAKPLFVFARMGRHSSAAFTTAFISGVSANAMLLDFYKEEKITKRQLYLSNFINQFPAYFLHLPSTFFIVIPLTGRAGVLYFLLTFLALLLRTLVFLVYGRLALPRRNHGRDISVDPPALKKKMDVKAILKGIRQKFPRRMTNIAVYVLPIYIFIFLLNAMGLFQMMNDYLSRYVTTSFIPMESLSVVVLSFVAEFTSGFAAAGALLNSGVITVKQTVLALLLGNVLAFPIRALRHQLPRYMGIFSPRMGAEILVMGQVFRVLSLIVIGAAYYFLG